MKKRIILFIVAGLFLVCSVPLFAEGNAGAGVCGIVIAGVVGFFGCHTKDKPATAPTAAEAPETESQYEFIRTKIAGVTFKDGRKSRQTILRRLYWKDDPFDKNAAEVTLERGEYEGKPAFAVLLNGTKAGYIPAEHAQFVEDNFERCDGVTHIEAYCGTDDIYGAKIIIRFRKK